MCFQACICYLSLRVRNAWGVFSCKSSEEFTLLLKHEAKIYFIDRTFLRQAHLIMRRNKLHGQKNTSGFTTQHALVLFDVNGLLLMYK